MYNMVYAEHKLTGFQNKACRSSFAFSGGNFGSPGTIVLRADFINDQERDVAICGVHTPTEVPVVGLDILHSDGKDRVLVAVLQAINDRGKGPKF